MRKDRLALDPMKILDIVCEYYELEKSSVVGKSRLAHIVRARHVARFLIRYNTNLGLNEIARLMIGSKHKGNDHTTILNSYNVVTNWMETDEDFNCEVQEIQMRVIEYKQSVIEKLRMELAERKLKVLLNPIETLPEPILVRMPFKSPADEVREKYL